MRSTLVLTQTPLEPALCHPNLFKQTFLDVHMSRDIRTSIFNQQKSLGLRTIKLDTQRLSDQCGVMVRMRQVSMFEGAIYVYILTPLNQGLLKRFGKKTPSKPLKS